MRGIPWPVAIVLVAAAFALGRGCRSDQGDADPLRARSRPVAAAGPAPESSPRPRARTEPSERGGPPAAAEPAEAPDDGPVEWPTFDVRVVTADGAPVTSGYVYALPAGSPGVEDLRLIPSAQVDENGAARLTLPRVGLWDVGGVSGTVGTLSLDRRAPSAEPVVLALPRMDSVRVVQACESLAKAPPPGACLFRSGETRTAPGRGEIVASTPTVFTSGTGTEVTVPVPFGAEFGVTRASAGYAVDRRTVSAGGTVTLLPGDGREVTVEIRPEFSGPPPVPGSYAVARLEWTDRAGPREEAAPIVFGDPEPGAAPQPHRRTFWMESSATEVRWSGDGVVPGRAAIGDARHEGRPLVVAPVCITGAAIRPPYVPPTVSADVSVADGPAPVNGGIVVCAASSGGLSSGDWNGSTVKLGVDDGPGPWTVSAWSRTMAAEQTASTRGGDDRAQVRVVRGGAVCVVADGAVPENAGILRIRRADGGVLPLQPFDGTGIELDFAHAFEGSVTLGALPPGRIDLEVLLGSTVIARLSPVVAAGRTAVLPVRIRPVAGGDSD